MVHGQSNPPSPEETAAMQEFRRFYDARRPAILASLFSVAQRPELAGVLALMSSEIRAEGYGLQTRAIFHGEWQPYLDYLKQWGEAYANAGVSYAAWLAFLRAAQEIVTDQLTTM